MGRTSRWGIFAVMILRSLAQAQGTAPELILPITAVARAAADRGREEVLLNNVKVFPSFGAGRSIAGPRIAGLRTAELTGDESSGYSVPAGEDPENRLLSPFVKHVMDDQKQFWTMPRKFHGNDLEWAAPAAGMMAAVIASDSWVEKQIPPNMVRRSQTASNGAFYSLVGLGAGSYLLGLTRNDDHLLETGLLSAEAAIDSTAVSYFFKSAFQRQRPYQGNQHGSFFQGGSSFPSEHAAAAWAIASIWAHEYPGAVSQTFAYGIASVVTLTRVTGREHFVSDALVGSVLGWYFARQDYRAHHDTALGGAPWGSLWDESWTEAARNPKNMGSPYVPLDSWVYASLERLAALGYLETDFLGMRPWTRMECARLLDEAQEKMRGDDSAEAGLGDTTAAQAERIYAELQTEFKDESGRLDGGANREVGLDSIYARSIGISGTPLRDGYHFAQTLINDYGRPYAAGVNQVAGVSGSAVIGPFSFSMVGEYQHSPSVASDPASVLQAIAQEDGVVTPLPNGSPTIDRFRLIEGSVGLTLGGVKLSFGKQSLWLGPGESGPLLMSDNAAPITMLQIDSASPFEVPLFSDSLGPVRMTSFLGHLAGQEWVYNPSVAAGLESDTNPSYLIGPGFHPQPFIHGNKISFRPTANLEFGMGVTVIFGGPGLPFTWHEYLRSYYGHNANTATNPGKRFSAFDFTYRVPGLRNWLTLYTDSMVGDEISPIGSTRPMLNPGLYMPQFPHFPKLELRVEGFKAEPKLGEIYIDRRYRSGYSNDGNLIGSWIGRQALGGQAWTKYSFSPRTSIQLGFRHQEVDRFLAGGGRLSDFSVATECKTGRQMSLSGRVQYEEWSFPALDAHSQSDWTAGIQLTLYPDWRMRH